jgi:uncharacterized membrane protein (UPF0127 family)
MVKCIRIGIKGKKARTNAFLYDTLLRQGCGLMFSGKKNLLFSFKREERVDLHMFFVFFPIDVLFLNSKKQVVEKARLLPFTLYFPSKPCRYILELSFPGFSEKAKIKDTLAF